LLCKGWNGTLCEPLIILQNSFTYPHANTYEPCKTKGCEAPSVFLFTYASHSLYHFIHSFVKH
jgi:hypothetical protein